MTKRGYGAWKELLIFVWTIFSIGPLTRSLLTPYHREGFSKGGEKASIFERVVFNIIMRAVGAVIRSVIIISGFLVLILALVTLPFFVLFHLSIRQESLYKHRAIGRDLSFPWTWRLKRAARELVSSKELWLVGKEEALGRLEQVLGRQRQSNALVVGKPGVGRSTLISVFATRVAWGRTLPHLRYKHVFELSLDGLNPSDVRILLFEAANAGNVIVVLENIHAYTHLFDELIQFTELPQLQIIAVTDTEHFHSVVKQHADFLQNFEKIEVEEPSEEEVISLVEATLSANKVKFDPSVPREIVDLTNRLVMHVPQPEKSIDVVAELLAKSPKEIKLEDVHALVSVKAGVPVGNLTDKERDTLTHLEEVLSGAVIGQEEVISGIAGALKRGRSGLAPKNRPLGSFLLLGPTGVGKTHTAKKLALLYYGSEESMVRFDMSEFSQEDSVDNFMERLVIAIEENPFTLILFDEIEKAHKKILNLFLQILDEAEITDTQGRQAKFYNAFVICTSNAGSDLIMSQPDLLRENFIGKLVESNIFTPEFLNRFDGTFLYRPLKAIDAEKITQLMLDEFVKRMRGEKGIEIIYTPELVFKLSTVAGQSAFGAREIRRHLEQTVENYIADTLISDNTGSIRSITIPNDLIK